MRKKMRTQETINLVNHELSNRGQQISIRKLARDLQISYNSMWHIVRSDLKLHPYEFQKAQLLTNDHKERRKLFCEKMLNLLQDDPQLFKRIIFPD